MLLGSGILNLKGEIYLSLAGTSYALAHIVVL